MNCQEASSGLQGFKTTMCSRSMVCMLAVLLLTSVWLCACQRAHKGDTNKNAVTVASDGTVTVQSLVIPLSSMVSPEAKASVAQHLKDVRDPAVNYQENGIPIYMKPYLARQKAMFPVDQQDTNIAGVHAYVFTPKEGVAAKNSKRVLIDLHGGGFSGCWPGCAMLESIAISSVGKLKIVSVDYREGPRYKFPAASEDVATVYSALLKQYPAKNIGIYGCSAGGVLTGMSIAWFERHNLPIPGAIGIFCAGAGGLLGDSMYVSVPIGDATVPETFMSQDPNGYMQGADMNDPLVQQANHPEVLAKFPPTLFVTGTRDLGMSSALYTNEQLNKVGVETRLFVWEGLYHAFFYNPDVPESQHAYRVITDFFDKELGK